MRCVSQHACRVTLCATPNGPCTSLASFRYVTVYPVRKRFRFPVTVSCARSRVCVWVCVNVSCATVLGNAHLISLMMLRWQQQRQSSLGICLVFTTHLQVIKFLQQFVKSATHNAQRATRHTPHATRCHTLSLPQFLQSGHIKLGNFSFAAHYELMLIRSNFWGSSRPHLPHTSRPARRAQIISFP